MKYVVHGLSPAVFNGSASSHQPAATAQGVPSDHGQSCQRGHGGGVCTTVWSRNEGSACSSTYSRGQTSGAALSDHGKDGPSVGEVGEAGGPTEGRKAHPI